MKPRLRTAILALAASLCGTGCVEMMVGNGPATASFTPPGIPAEIRPPLPREALFGSWSAELASDYFIAGDVSADHYHRIMSYVGRSTLVLNADGTCTSEETLRVRENWSAIYGYPQGTSQRLSYAGTWEYGGGILTLRLQFQGGQTFPLRKAKASVSETYSVKWYAPDRISLAESIDQFNRNAESSGYGPGWNRRTTYAPRAGNPYWFSWTRRTLRDNGVEVLWKDDPLDEKVLVCPAFYVRAGGPAAGGANPAPPASYASTPSPSVVTQVVVLAQQPVAATAPEPPAKPPYDTIRKEYLPDGTTEIRVHVNDTSRTFDIDRLVQPRIAEMFRQEFLDRNPLVPQDEIRVEKRWTTDNSGTEMVYRGGAFSFRPEKA